MGHAFKGLRKLKQNAQCRSDKTNDLRREDLTLVQKVGFHAIYLKPCCPWKNMLSAKWKLNDVAINNTF